MPRIFSPVTWLSRRWRKSDERFHDALVSLSAVYLLLIVAMLAAMASFTSPRDLWLALDSKEIRYSAKLSLLTCTMTAILSLWVAVPLGYLLSRYNFPGKTLVDALLDIPIVLPPLVIGLGLLILFQTSAGQFVENRFQVPIWWNGSRVVWWPSTPGIRVTFAIPSVILAQFTVACAFAVRTMRVTFDQINPRQEQVALTLGCNRSQAFWSVVLPEARRGMVTAGSLAWARSLGEFGPILIFSGATRMRTEVLPTSVFLEMSIGNVEAAVAVSLLMVIAATTVLIVVRIYGIETDSKAVK